MQTQYVCGAKIHSFKGISGTQRAKQIVHSNITKKYWREEMQKPRQISDSYMRHPNKGSSKKQRYATFQCYCGNEFETQVRTVRRGQTLSCGCYSKEKTKERNTSHGLSSKSIYNIWVGMKGRVLNKNNTGYKEYGGRGIYICEKWLTFEGFYDDMGASFIEGLSIDRIDNNSGYCKENCRWTDSKTQQQNTRLIQKRNTTGYRGVMTAGSNWHARIQNNKKRIFLGAYDNPIDAAKAYDAYVIENNTNHPLNFKSISEKGS